jgi:class 3 adenylate cyclase
MQEFILKRNAERVKMNLPEWNIRIGINTGQLVAGVVGKKKYAYDIWGSTVNVASRMESNGEPGRVNISSATYELIKDKYLCTHRGKIFAKNIGEVDMYFVENEIR